MNPQHLTSDDDEMQPEYDFSAGVRGKHYRAYRAGANIVLLEPDLVSAFPDSAAVNQALRLLVRLSKSKAMSTSRSGKARQPASGARKKAKSKPRARATRG